MRYNWPTRIQEKHSRKPIIHGNGSLNVEEAISLMEAATTASTAVTAASLIEASLQHKRAPLRCSKCHQIGHTRASCPNHQI